MLKTRIATAAILIIGLVTALFLTSKTVWALLSLGIILVGVWEWSGLIKLSINQRRGNVIAALLIAVIFLFSLNYPDNLTSSLSASLQANIAFYRDAFIFILIAIAAVFWLLLAPIWLFIRKPIQYKFGMAVLGLLLLLAVWLAFMGLRNISPWLLLSVLATVSIADSAAYFAGKRFGRHKLAPEISPGKTWEGVLGGLVAVSVYGYFLCLYLHYSLWLLVGLWLIVVLSILGDLFESLLKRFAGAKDSGQCLPGHGGILDRIDGLIPSLTLTLLYIYLPLFLNFQSHA